MPPVSASRALLVQPFSLHAKGGGGSRILTSMLRGQPFEARSISAETHGEEETGWPVEKHVRLRPTLGRLDRTRFSWIGYWTEIPFLPLFRRRLARAMEAAAPQVVHVLPHWSCDFHEAWRVARRHGWRVVMSVHDDLAYALPATHPLKKRALEMLARMWTDVDHVFAISRELGEEYNARYGARPFDLITDGLEDGEIAPAPRPAVPDRFVVYFMGLFHYNYRENLQALTRALARLKLEQPGLDLQLVMRCGGFEKNIDAAFPARVLPYADQAAVRRDMETADLLYMPLPFGAGHQAFARFSLSTKMVSYLGAGTPILFHGPDDSAAARLLGRHEAAFTCPSLEEDELLARLRAAASPGRERIIANALRLARSDFRVEDLRRRFLRGLFPDGVKP